LPCTVLPEHWRLTAACRRVMLPTQVAQASDEYAGLLAALPQEFVGPLPTLVSLVTVRPYRTYAYAWGVQLRT
jgi:hypothetical protein